MRIRNAQPRMEEARSLFGRGLFASLPVVVGYLPVGMTFGLAAVGTGFPAWAAVLTSALVFAGASQFVLVSLLPQGFLPAVVLPLFLNLRHVVYTGIVARRIPLSRPALTLAGLTDEVFAVALRGPAEERFLQGVALGAYLAWVGGTALGAFGGAAFLVGSPIEGSLVFSLTALFFVLVIPSVQEGRLRAVLWGAGIGLVFHVLGLSSLGVLAAGLVTPLVLRRRR